jgi:hypothetical protein
MINPEESRNLEIDMAAMLKEAEYLKTRPIID